MKIKKDELEEYSNNLLWKYIDWYYRFYSYNLTEFIVNLTFPRIIEYCWKTHISKVLLFCKFNFLDLFLTL